MDFTTIIDVAELKGILDDHDLVVIDCRFDLADVEAGRKAFDQQRIPGAVFADLDEDLSSPHPVTDKGRHPLPSVEGMAETFGKLGIDAQKQVVAYDNRNNMLASRLWWMLQFMGHSRAAVLNGGWDAWQNAGGPLEAGSPQPPKSTEFVGRPQLDRLVRLEEVTSQALLIDSRAPERYRGEVEPLDPVAGHIPGAVNFYYAGHLNDQKQLCATEQIKANLESVFGDTPAEEATFYCGSGVSACVNLLAAKHAGFPMSKLYVGSWSEWCREQD